MQVVERGFRGLLSSTCGSLTRASQGACLRPGCTPPPTRTISCSSTGDCVPRQGFIQCCSEGRSPRVVPVDETDHAQRALLQSRYSGDASDLALVGVCAASPVHRHARSDGRGTFSRSAIDAEPGVRASGFRSAESRILLVGVAFADFERVNGHDTRCIHADDGEDQGHRDTAVQEWASVRMGRPMSTVLHLWHPTRSKRGGRLPLFRETMTDDDRMDAVAGVRELAGWRSPSVR